MTVARRKLTTVDKLKIVVAQAKCPLCGEKLGDLDGIDFDHAHALTLGGADSVENLRAVHRDCHAVKTFGPGGEKRVTSAGGDIHARAHSERLARKQRLFRERMLAQAEGREPVPLKGKPKRHIPSRPLRGGSSFKNRSKP